MVSGSGYISRCLTSISLSSRSKGSSGGESGWRVVDDDNESSVSEFALEDGERDLTLRVAAERCRERMVCVMCDSENGRCWEGSGLE